MFGKNNDKSLIVRLTSGNLKAYEELFNVYYIRVKRFALGFVKDEHEAEEISQNVFMKIWVNREMLAEDLSLNSYIFTITKNEVIDYFRQNSYFIKYQSRILGTNSESEYEIDSEFNIKQIKEIVSECIRTMPEQRKQVFIMSREQYLSNEEIAQKLSISKRTVEKPITLALKTLKARLNDFLNCFLF